MNDSDKSTRARARVGTYVLDRTNPEVTRLLRSLTTDDYAYISRRAKEALTPAGFELLKTILRMTMQTPSLGPGMVVGTDGYRVQPFTRSQLGNYLRKGARLNPHDIKSVNQMVKLGLLRQERAPLPARRIPGHDGGELMVGAGWEYVYIVPPQAALSLLWASNRHHGYITELHADPSLDLSMPDDPGGLKGFWKTLTGR